MIQQVKIENLCTIKDVEFDLSDISVAMIVGESGSGKTTFIGSIFACLYGSFPDKPEQSLYDDVLNKEAQAKISVTIDISGKSYVIQRIIDNKDRRCYAYVYNINDMASPIVGPQIKGFNQWISNNLFDKNIFLALYYLSQKKKNDICDLAPSVASTVLMGLFGLDSFSDTSKKYQELAKDANKNLVYVDNQFSIIRTAKSRLEESQIKIQQCSTQIDECNKELSEIDMFLNNSELTELSKNITRIQTDIAKSLSSKEKLELSNKAIRKQQDVYKVQENLIRNAACKKGANFEYPSCPFLNADKIAKNLQDLQDQIDRNNKDMSKLDKELAQQRTKLQELTSEDKPGFINKKIISQEQKKNVLSLIAAKNKELGGLENEIEHLQQIISKESTLKKEKEIFRKNALYADFLYRTFGRRGAPSLIVESSLEEINIIANTMCTEYYVPFKFALTFTKEDSNETLLGSLNVVLLDEASKPRHVSSYSGGEMQLAQIVLRFAIQEYLKKYLAKDKLAIFIADEPWSEMDSNLAELAYNIINDKSELAQILIISHDTSFCSKFENVIEVTKLGNETKIELVQK